MDINTTLELQTGRQMPVLGLGTWELNLQTASTISQAIAMGYPMIDTSRDYGTQAGIGEGIKKAGIARDRIYVVTKIEETDDAYEAAKANVSEIGLDYADLILIHRPPNQGAGENLWRGLIRAREEGITKDIGVSNYSENLITHLAGLTGEVPVVNQIEWSPFGWSASMLDYCKTNNIVIQGYSPLTRGIRLYDDTIQDLADKYDKTTAQILLRWAIQIGVVPIVKANKTEHLEENLEVFDFTIAPEDMILLNNLDEDFSTLSIKPIYQENRR